MEEQQLTENDLLRLTYQAKLAEQAERFDDMANFIDKIIECKKSLTEEEQKLFAIAYKNCIGKIRTAWRLADTARARYEGSNETKKQFAIDYAEELGSNILSVCNRVEENLKTLGGMARDAPTKLNYAKMFADYRRYRCEIEPTEQVSPSHPIRMGLALNYSVFKYEIENQLEEACRIADEALASARASGIPDTREAFMIQQLLQDNVNLWRSEQATVPSRSLLSS